MKLNENDSVVKSEITFPCDIKRITEDVIYFTEICYSQIKLDDKQREMLRQLSILDRISFAPDNPPENTKILNIFIIWYLIKNKDKTVGISSYTKKQSNKILAEIKELYNELPAWIQSPVTKWNVNEIGLKNGCKVFTSSVNAYSFRGLAINFLYINKTYLVKSEDWEKFKECVLPVMQYLDSKFVTWDNKESLDEGDV